MKRLFSLLIITVTLFFLGAMSMSVQAEIEAGAIGQRGHRILGSPFGTEFKDIRCSDGFVPVGLTIQGGTYVHGVNLICARVSDGRMTSRLRRSNFAGNRNGNHSRTRRCPANYVLSGIKARGAVYVDRINSIRCTQFGGTRTKFVDVGAGGRGGKKTARMYCSGSESIHSLDVYFGGWIDWIEAFC